MTKIFLFIFITYGGEQYAMDVGQFDDEIACRITMEEVFDDLQADGFVITVDEARRQRITPRSLMMVAAWNEKRGKILRHRMQAAQLRRVAAQLAADMSAGNDSQARRRAA